MTPLFARLWRWLDERLGWRTDLRRATGPAVPVRWSSLLGVVAVVLFGVLVVTGVLLACFYRPGVEPVVYQGSAALYDGRELPRSFASVIAISNDLPGGLFLRRLHRGGAGLFVAVVVLHLLRVQLTGAFRRPRELNYLVGVALLLLALVAGWTGQNLPFELLAGTSLRVGQAIMGSVPFVGDAIVAMVYGGTAFPTSEVMDRLWGLHLLASVAMLAGVGVHLWILRRQGHAGLPSARYDSVPLRPRPRSAALALSLLVPGLLAATAVLVPWSDVEIEGPYQVGRVSNAGQPDWYLFWPDGAMRILPAMEVEVLGVTVGNVFLAAVALPGAIVGLLVVFPWLDRWLTGDRDRHDLLAHPYAEPTRFAAIVLVLTVMVVLSVGATDDKLAEILALSVEQVVAILRIVLLVGPAAAGALAWWYARRYGGPATDR